MYAMFSGVIKDIMKCTNQGNMAYFKISPRTLNVHITSLGLALLLHVPKQYLLTSLGYHNNLRKYRYRT